MATRIVIEDLCKHGEIGFHLLSKEEWEEIPPKVRHCPGGSRRVLTVCPSCSHEWRKHDPEDGKCDAYPGDDHCNPHEVAATFARAALLAYARHTHKGDT